MRRVLRERWVAGSGRALGSSLVWWSGFLYMRRFPASLAVPCRVAQVAGKSTSSDAKIEPRARRRGYGVISRGPHRFCDGWRWPSEVGAWARDPDLKPEASGMVDR